MSDSPVQTATPLPAEEVAQEKIPFFSRRDKVAFCIAAVAAFVGYFATLAPSVTLEDSGEFLTAARNLGVPHPPGYPIWTILAWIWQLVFPFGNIAWRVNLMSAIFGAIAVGLGALLISKSGHVMARRVGFLNDIGKEQIVHLIILASSVSAALMFAFSPVMWSQSVITEVYALNAFFLMVTLVLLYRWSFETDRRWMLYLAGFIWGVSLTNHQTLVLLTVAFPTFIWLSDRKLGRDVLLPILVVIIGGIFWMIISEGGMFHEGVFSATVLVALGIGMGFWVYILFKQGPGLMRMWKQMLAVYASVLLGLALYGYMPLSSATNPPMNWGYTRTTEGFIHHFTRGQYEKVHTERTLLQFWGQLNMFFDDLKSQFNIVFALLPLIALFFYRDLAEHDRDWLKFLLVAFLFLSLGFIFLSNPTFEKQKQFTDRVFFLPGHALYALWIGYGMILGFGYLLSTKPGTQRLAIPMAGLVFALPVVSFAMSWADLEQRGHDFGYRFGYLMFEPGGGYPDMDKDAVLYGGTDPGRFVPTYMILVESLVSPRSKTHFAKYPGSGTFDRRDVYIITQNALADSTYMNYIRDHYDYSRPDANHPESLANRSAWQRTLFMAAWNLLDRKNTYPKEPIWIPSERDAQSAFQQYVQELQTRQPMPGEDVRVEGGRVSVQGVAGVMAINGILTKMIFDKNKDKHAFYVEESYVIPWMYPYMEPHGIILKINKEPLAQIDAAMIERDRKYWDALTEDLKNDPRFHRDDVAQKTFSKLRSAIGGLYAYRRLINDAEYAYKQAVELCPDSPEANFRLAQLYVETGRFDDSLDILNRYQARDEYNTKIREAVNSIKDMKNQVLEQQQLEQQYAANPGNLQAALQLIVAYAKRQRVDAMDGLVSQLIARPDFPFNEFLQICQIYAQVNRLDRVTELLTVLTQRYPQNPIGWYNLAVVLSTRKSCDEAMTALERALALDSADRQILNTTRQDPRFNNCRQNARFQRLMGQTPQKTEAPPGGFTITR